MRLNGHHVGIAFVALALGAVPAFAQTGFQDDGSAAGDQYGTTSTGPSATVGVTATATVGGSGSDVTPVTPPVADRSGPSDPAVDDAGGDAPGAGATPGNGPGAGSGAGAGVGSGPVPGAGGVGGPGVPGGVEGAAAGTIGLLSIGDSDEDTLNAIAPVIGTPAFEATIDLPIPESVLRRLAGGTDDDQVRDFAERLARSAVRSGPLANSVLPLLTGDSSTADYQPLSAIILTRATVPPRDEFDDDPFTNGFMDGLEDSDVPSTQPGTLVNLPVAGLETTSTEPSTVPYYSSFDGVATVDNVDQPAGLDSLRRVLSGAEGHFGVKDTARDGRVADEPDGAPPLNLNLARETQPSSSAMSGTLAMSGVLLLLVLFAGRSVYLSGRHGRPDRHER